MYFIRVSLLSPLKIFRYFAIESYTFFMLLSGIRSFKNKNMFKALVTNLPFSPALVGQIGFYARRLKREETTRRLGLIVTALALVVQSFAVFVPAESANASNSSDLITGGIKDKTQLLNVYNASKAGNGDYKTILDYAGITESELKAVKETSINSIDSGKAGNAWLSWGRLHRFSASDGEVKHVVPSATGSTTVYSRPLWLFDSTSYTKKNGSTYQAFIGHSAKIGDFAILKNCGNIVTKKTPQPAPKGVLSATCDVIRGTAYDGRNRALPVKVYLYLGGAPGTGEKVGPITASGSGNTFSYAVPAKYQTKASETRVWGVLVPLAGWSDTTVPFEATAVIPGGCKTVPKPIVECLDLSKRVISRTDYSFVAKARAENGATIKGYNFVVTDKSGKVVAQKAVPPAAATAHSGAITLAAPGDYAAWVVVNSSLGDIKSNDCAKAFTVAPPEKCVLNPDLLASDKDCKPCPGNPQIWYKDDDCKEVFTQSKAARNLSQNADATTVTARAADRIEYRVTIENPGQVPVTTEMKEDLSDVLEYATLHDNGAGTFDSKGQVLSWGTMTIPAGGKETRSFVVNVKDEIPSTARGASEPGSFDCIMTNTFGNSTQVKIDCPAQKAVEGVTTELPKTGPGENMLFAGVIASVITYFYARSRQLGREVRLIRKDFNLGTL